MILRGIGDTSVASIATAPNGSESELSAYIVATAPTGDFSTFANRIAVNINGAWIPKIPKKGQRVWVEDEKVYYYYNGTLWKKDSGEDATKMHTEYVQIIGNTVTLTKVPAGDILPIKIGFLDSNGDFIQVQDKEEYPKDSVIGRTISLTEDYETTYGTGVAAQLKYVINDTEEAQTLTFDTELADGAAAIDNVELATTNPALIQFNNLNVNEDPVADIKGGNIMVSGSTVGQVQFTTSYLGHVFYFIQSGVTYEGIFAENTINVSAI